MGMNRFRAPITLILLALFLLILIGSLSMPTADGAKYGSKLATVRKIRHISSGSYTRVILDLSDKVQYSAHAIKENPSKGFPPRVYVDLIGARLSSSVKRKIVVQDRLLKTVRVGQFRSEVVRVVLDMKNFSGHRAFLLPDPYRLVMDVQGKYNRTKWAKRRRKSPAKGTIKEIQRNGFRKIVLDPGHGGRDPGAVGSGGIAEKDIVLRLAKELAKKLRGEMGIDVILTRRDDRFVPLETRTAFANAQNADLFISLHINASPDPRMRGIESYYLDNATDEATIRLAARENGTSRRNISDLQFILSDLTQNSKLEESIGLAHHLQSSLVSRMRRKNRWVKNLGVKKGLFYVLVGARMPSVLLETFFMTNRNERRSLARPSFQNAIVEAIYLGIKEYKADRAVARNL